MKRVGVARATAAMAAGLILLVASASRAQAPREQIQAIVKEYLATHQDEIGEIVKGYLIKHPEAFGEIVAEMREHRPAANADIGAGGKLKPLGVVASNATLLFSSAHQVTLGNPDGDVTLVEFFDYNCGFCKRALADMLALLRDDPKLKIVLKELPILGPGSVEAARVAVAVRMQDPDGQRYLAFHQKLLGDRGQVGRDKALAAAKDQGLDMASLGHDMASDEVRTTIAEGTKLAHAVGITGTPGYVIGDNVLLGAVGIAALKAGITSARGHGGN